MNNNFTLSLIEKLVINKDYLPFSNYKINPENPINYLVKNEGGNSIVLALADADRLSVEQIQDLLDRNSQYIMGLSEQVVGYFFSLFIFSEQASIEKINVIVENQYNDLVGRKFSKSFSINLKYKTVERHFSAHINTFNIDNIVSEHLMNEDFEDFSLSEIERTVSQKRKDYRTVQNDTTPKVTYVLIAVNVLIFIGLYFYSFISNIQYARILNDFGAKDNSLILGGEYFRFFTPMFLHVDPMHIIFNSYSLLVLGGIAEKIFKSVRFAIIYLVSGLMGSFFSFAFSGSNAVGASGAIFGLFGALLFFGLEKPKVFKSIFGYSIFIVMAINLFYGFAASGIDNFGHIGGLLGGFLICGAVRNSDNRTFYLNRYIYAALYLVLAAGILYLGFSNNVIYW